MNFKKQALLETWAEAPIMLLPVLRTGSEACSLKCVGIISSRRTRL